MRERFLQREWVARAVLLVLLLSVVGMSQSLAQTEAHEYVDLGLPSGTLWATCNIGANSPEDYGDYFAWGETQPKDYYDWNTYQYCEGSYNTLTKYCNDSSYGYNGFTDTLTVLLPEDDAATANWGSGWRMPTKKEWQELYQNTTHTWTTQNGVNGRLFTAANGASLFLPAAGYRWSDELRYAGGGGYYWLSSLDTDYPNGALGFCIDSGYWGGYGGERNYGRSVRAVRSTDPPTHTYIDLGLPSGTLWATCNVGANSPEDYGDYFAWGETQPKDYYGWENYLFYGEGEYPWITCTKYNQNGLTLLPEDDPATTQWGASWRMPTDEDWQELLDNTTNEWTTQNGVNGVLLTALNGNSLFLPGTGYWYLDEIQFDYSRYWSSSVDYYWPNIDAEALAIRTWGDVFNIEIDRTSRSSGLPVRPVRQNLALVTATANPAEGGTIEGAGSYAEGSTCTLTATASEGYTFVNWTENGEVVSTNPEYSFVVTSNRNLVAEFEKGVVVGDQSSTIDYFPLYTYYNYTLTQQIYTAEEIGRGGLITAISFNYTGNESTDLTNTIDVYLKHTSKSAFEYDTDWESVGTSDLHFSGTLLTDAVAGWKRIELDTPFEYNGTDNLLVCVNNNSGFWTDVRQWYAYPTGENRAICAYSYYTNYDPFNPMQYSGTLYDVNNEILISIQTLGPATFVSNPNPIDLGVRPNGAWMRPAIASITNLGSMTPITNILASNNYFQPNLDELSMPFVLGYEQSFDLGIGWGTGNGVINANLLVDYGDGQQAQIPMTATAYEPSVGDVWENPIQLNSFPYTATFNSANHPLYDNYVLPPANIADGADVVCKMTFTEDTYLNANVTSGDNGKVALYREGFQGLGGPDLENNYTGPEMVIEEWLYYDNGENVDAIGTGGGEFWWGIKLDVTAYQGAKLTKVSMYDYANMEGEIMIYQTEGTPYGDPLLRQNFSITGSGEFVEFNLNMPYTLDASLPLWIVMHHVSGSGWTASCCYDTGDPNGRWVSLDNSYWEDLVNYGLNYTWMLRGMVTNRNGREVVLGDRSEIQNLTVTPGVYYLVASSTSNEWTVEINAGEVPCPDMAYNPVPENRAEEVTPNNVSLRWTLGDRTTEYCLRFGTNPNDMETLVDWTRELNNHYSVSGLHNNTIYYWQVCQRNDGCPEGIDGTIWSFTTHLNVPSYLWANSDQIFEGDWNALYWEAPAERGLLSYNVYQDGLLIGNTTDTYYEISNLPYNMNGYRFNVTAVYDEGESSYSNDYWVYVSGYGTVEGYVYEQDGTTPIEGAAVNFTGYNEFWWYSNFQFITDAHGHYRGTLCAGNYNVQASGNGYQTKDYNENVYIGYNVNTSGINFILDEQFKPVGNVVAEYYPDANDPNSPYVKVYWSDATNLVEDFETGDFSKFNWQMDGTYPWQITTDYPYEGNFCMKSGNQGYHNTTSWIQVTVYVPYDSYITFNGRMSSEDGCDYGEFYIDGNWYDGWSGYIDWFEASYPVSAGTHDFTWNYSKDGSVDSNDDSFYVDNICFASQERGERSFQHYRVYRTDEYNYGPFNEDNTVVLAEATNDTLLIDISWSSLEMGSYKYGVSCVYEGNRESEIRWGGLQQIQPKLTCSSRQQHVRHQGNNRDEVIFRDGFENGMDNWTTIDADGDGYCWEMGSNLAHNGSGYVTSSSWMSNIGMLYPDNYLVTPQVSLGGIFSFWACAEDASYAADHFGVAVSTGSNNNPYDFTLVQEWTMTAKGNRYDGPRGSRSQGNWYYYEVDLSEYSGQTGYIALRHFNCSDWYYLNVDDIELWMNSLPVQGPRESQIVWSSPMAKDLLLTDGAVNVTVTLNSGDSPEGTVVSFYNLDYNEQMYHSVADVVLDGSGYYAWDLFRKGEYYVTISKEGYGTVSEYVSIYESTAMRYQLEEIMTGISDLYVSRTGWATWSGPYVNGFAVPTTNSTFEFNFESNLEGWTNIDADGDGHVWYHSSEAGNHGTQAITSHNGTGHLMGESYCNSNGVLYPDNYLVSPQQYRITNGSTLSFWACTQDVNYPAEHFGVAISTASNTNPYDFTTIAEWTITAKSGQSTKGGTGRDGAEGMRAGEWYQFTCDLSAYAGQQAWIALRHFNCSDMFIVCVDELTLSTNAKDGDRHLQNVQVMLSDLNGNILYTGETENDYMQLPVESLMEGQTYHLAVGSVYSSGLSNWDEVDWQYEPCDNYEGAADLIGQTVDEGVMLSWTYPEIDSSSTQTRGSMVYACKDESTWINYDLSNPYNTTALNYFTVRGGDYCSRDGYVYSTNYYNWYKIEPQTGIIVEQGNFDLYCFYDCAWDRTTNTMYGNYDSDLYSWNLETKELQYIGNLGNSFAVLACDRNGQLYGIAFEFPANLYKINKYNASTEWVGSIGYDCDYYYQSGAIDPSSGKFYWACYPRNNGSLIEVNLQTGAGTELYTGIGEQNSFCFSSSFDTDFDIAAMIFRDGEYLGITTDSTFLDEGGSREREYTMRVVYGGEAICPDENFYFSMSCPQTFEVYGPIVTQTTQFAEGWTWWSTYVNQDHIDGLNLLEEGLGDNGMQIKSQTQFVQNYGEMWMGTLSDIDNESSYMVQVSAPCTVSMTTEQVVPYDHPITLNEGWNWVGYPSASAASVSNALSGHMPAEGDFLKSQTSCAIYYSALGWIGSLKTLTPGMGLMYKSNSNETISFTYTVDRMDNLEDNITAAGNRWEPNVQAYPNNMSVLAVVELDDNELRNENYELAAFVNGECRGSAKLMFVESLNRYMAFLTVYGEEASELNFGLYDVETGMTTFESNEHLNFVINAITGDLMEPYVVSFRSTTAIDELDGNLQIYPNPVGKGNIFSITMPIGGSKVQVEIVNALGVVEMQYITSTQTPMTFKAPNVAGVYTLRIIVEGQRPYIRKLIVR